MRYKPNDVILRARNGDVIACDETGLILRLSDQVIRDIAERIGPGAQARLPARDIREFADRDVWNVRQSGAWVLFDACMPEFDHTRAFRKPVQGGDVIADTPGPLLSVLTIGGTKASDRFGGVPGFPHHVVAPADELGSAGSCGTETHEVTGDLQHLPERTQVSDLADALVEARHAAGRALPLIVARTETDGSATVADLADSPAMQNLAEVFNSLSRAAETLGKNARVLAVTINYGAEDVTSTTDAFVVGLNTLADRLNALCHTHDMPEPLILIRCDGTPERAEAQWYLAVHPAGRKLCVSAPAYMFERDAFGRITQSGSKEQAALDCAAIETVLAGKPWRCPVILLAERSADAQDQIDLVVDSLEELVIDSDDRFNAGPDHGFRLSQSDGTEIALKSIEISSDDPRLLVMRAVDPLPSGDLALTYAQGCPGALRDTWKHTDRALHRWALPSCHKVW